MAGIVVSVSVGVMKPLLDKLCILMGDEYRNLKGLRKEVSFLKCELSDVNALLEKMEDADELDPQAKNWRKDIIEMSYDIEDYIDDFMARVGEDSDKVGVLRKASHFLKTFKDQRRLAKQFNEIKTLVTEAGERRKRYLLDQCIQSTTHETVDPRLSALYQKSENLVGIDNKKEEIVRWVMDDGQQLKFMSIVGSGGLGKTTLANEVYREVGGKFDCKAFVTVSQSPDIVKLLNSLMLQLGLQPYSHACELQDLINKIIEYLHDKRYLIIVDDLWDTRAWSTVSCVFLPNNHYSRVMITTRIENMARACCGNYGFIYYMDSLSEQDSRKLFFDRICGSEDTSPPDIIEASCKILKKCGGLPLAIITMASIIACQPISSQGQYAKYVQSSLRTESATNPTYEDMMCIIDFSYKNLPHHLKACFLYLGTYPEDHKIERVDLVRRWVAEGFVSSYGHDVWDVAERCFNELVNRSMIQPAYKDYFDIYIEATHYTVHDMMLELILKKCRENNFLSLIDSPRMMLEGQDRAVRRLTIDSRRGVVGGIMVLANTRHLSKVRSLTIISRSNCRIPNLEAFKFMRLLYVHVKYGGTPIDLRGINIMSQLRYLSLKGYVLLPTKIRGLRLLEILDLSKMNESCGLEGIDDVPHLSHASMPIFYGAGLTDGIFKVTTLVTLRNISLAKSSLQSIMGLGELTVLTELILTCRKRDNGDIVPSPTLITALITSIKKLNNLKRLTLCSNDTIYCGDTMLGPSFLPPFRKIEELRLGLFIFSGVPMWISHLHCLRVLYLYTKQIQQEDFNIIGKRLTALVELILRTSCIPTERIVIGGSTGFNVLRSFRFDSDGVSCLTFEEGAMPDLRELNFVMDPDRWDKATPVGLQHLPCLKIINAYAAVSEFPEPDKWSAREFMLRDVFGEVADTLPTRPTVPTGTGIAIRNCAETSFMS